MPYQGASESRVIYLVAVEKKAPPRPDFGLCDDIWDILNSCWAEIPSERPRITSVRDRLKALFPPHLPKQTCSRCKIKRQENIYKVGSWVATNQHARANLQHSMPHGPSDTPWVPGRTPTIPYLPLEEKVKITEWEKNRVQQKDGSTLRQVPKLFSDKDQEKDKITRSADDRPTIHQYLLTRCQDGSDLGWRSEEGTLATKVSKVCNNVAESVPNWGDRDSAAEVGRRGPGPSLTQFSDQILNLQTSTRVSIVIMLFMLCLGAFSHFNQPGGASGPLDPRHTINPNEQGIESSCKLLVTIGQNLDRPKKPSLQ